MMQEKHPIHTIVDIYSEAAGIPVMYFENTVFQPAYVSNNLDFEKFMEFGELGEIESFLELICNEADGNGFNPDTFHTYYTKSYFAYNIVIVSTGREQIGALISGPIITFLPDEYLFEEIALKKKLSLQKKVEYYNTIKNLPLASEERTKHLGELLLVLTNPAGSGMSALLQRIHGNDIPDRVILLRNSVETTLIDRERNDHYSLYMFTLKLKEKITRGIIEGIAPMTIEYINQHWEMRSDGNNYRSLKNKCLMICSATSVFAAQADASYERIISTLSSVSDKMEKETTATGIIRQMITAIETFAYLVSIKAFSNYSLHIKRVLQHIRAHYSEKITLGQLAEQGQLTPEYLSHLIKKETNCSLLDLINTIRIEESKFSLIHSSKSMQEIAHEVGFSYQNHFCHVFRKYLGITPSEYRNQYSKNYFI